MVTVTADAVRAAHQRIPLAFRDSPQFVSEALRAELGVPVVVKVETVNPIGCFKGRGTWLAMSELAQDGAVGERSGVIAASAGNFGQGVAYAGRELEIPVVVFAAATASPAKVAAMRRLGAEVRLVGEDFDAAREGAAEHSVATGWHLLVDGQDPWIAIGAGTMALEMTDGMAAGALPELASIYVPVGNGALIAGIGTWLRRAAPAMRVIGVQAAEAPAMTLSWRARAPIETLTANTVADGIAARVPVAESLDLMIQVVDEMVLVDEDEIVAGTETLSAALPFAVEPSVGAAWAAIRKAGRHDQPIGLIVTGGNLSGAEAASVRS